MTAELGPALTLGQLLDRSALRFERGDLFRFSAKWWSYLVPPVEHPLLGATALLYPDWPDAEATAILEAIHRAAPADSKLLLIENVLDFARPIFVTR